MSDKDSRIFVAGHRGMVGTAIVRRLKACGYRNLLLRSREQLDLVDQSAVQRFFAAERPECVILAAAKVGGIHANATYPADFIYDNLMIEANVIEAARRYAVERLLFLGSSCIYPREAAQPMSEDALLTGRLEPTNEPYAIAKIAGIKLCESCNRQYGSDFRSVMPTNLYGPGDNFHPENSHVIPGLIRRMHDAKQRGDDRVVIWGSGTPKREFLHVDDMAAASLHVFEAGRADYLRITEPMLSHINIGTGQDCSIRELAEMIRRVVGYAGELDYDTGKPDGAPRKLLDVTRLLEFGWRPSIDLEPGLASTYQWFLEHQHGSLRV